MNRGLLIIIAIVFSLNLFVLDYLLLWPSSSSLTPGAVPSAPAVCGADCRRLVDTLLQEKLSLLPTSVPPTVTPVQHPAARTSARTTQYIPVPGQGSILDSRWTDLPGTEFYLSLDDYPALSESYFEANVRLQNGNGRAFFRIFDITAGIEVWGSEISTASQQFTSVSSDRLTLRPGNRLYRIQARSLTADTSIFNSGRIKLIQLSR